MKGSIVTMPNGYAPKFFASAVLPDGRVIVEGGEYNYVQPPPLKWSNQGAIYNPVTMTWQAVLPPKWPTTGKAWTRIGDAPSVVLSDGTFMLGSIYSDTPGSHENEKAAWLDPATLTWNVAEFNGKADINSEEGWTLLPDGNVLTVDVFGQSSTGTNSEIYQPGLDLWTTAGSTVSQLWSKPSLCGKPGNGGEIGPAVLRPDGTVFATGANFCNGPGNTAVYFPALQGWWPSFPIPNGNDVADGPASILPDGNVLVDTSPGYGTGPSTFFEFTLDDEWLTIPQPTLAGNPSTEGGRMVVTGEGSVLFVQLESSDIFVYTKKWTYPDSYRPTICEGCFPTEVTIGNTYTVSGTQFNGLSQGAAYGDDAQSATNFPLVLITNADGNKYFARTHGFTSMGVATGNQIVSAQFDILPGTETGPSTMVVIANGIPSQPEGILVLAPN